ncbi:Protein CBG14875 [Caenorhabditis briggsae]|uniref:Skp1-related protein n=2 Tax=Caenorhabditis briggsae TaxID=6238 RepID=A0AAE9DSI6_CAEBR|nr:Protein CBG14875 [Caenorhabditis briggsae]ULU09956.1 hypothetical protein L3Y34_014365 [Caenorhabditis briggsae]CAP33287.2 Protein CBG14875 [Caenorhabditis briggsae]
MELSGERKLRFKTSDGKIIESYENPFKLSQTIKDCLENNGGIPEEIPLESISSTTLKNIIKWLDFYKNLEFEEEVRDEQGHLGTCFLQEFDIKFFSTIDLIEINQILKASKFLDIDRLRRAGCAHMATLIRGSSVEEMKNFFAFDSDDDEEQMA